eukprot:m.472804 g.472804  ORF g.472804 m.472804 type:complete len:243 (-) comp20387_c0_seq6:1682-2410(-)
MWLRVGRASDSVVGLVAGLLGYARDAGGLKQKTEQRNKEHDERLAAEAEAGTDPRGILGVDEFVIKSWLSRGVVAGSMGRGLFTIFHRRPSCSCCEAVGMVQAVSDLPLYDVSCEQCGDCGVPFSSKTRETLSTVWANDTVYAESRRLFVSDNQDVRRVALLHALGCALRMPLDSDLDMGSLAENWFQEKLDELKHCRALEHATVYVPKQGHVSFANVETLFHTKRHPEIPLQHLRVHASYA